MELETLIGRSMLKVSVIITVYNEEKNIVALLNALNRQSVLPAEVIITDAGSTDKTRLLIDKWTKKNRKIKVRTFAIKGNRSIGRNFAVKKSRYQWLAITDAGCIPRRNWLLQLIKAAEENRVEVVAGYYHGLAKNLLQKAMLPYMLVMPDQVSDNFLPATRSMLISKSLWLSMGGLDENLSLSEDYHFAKKLQKNKIDIVFNSRAIVDWRIEMSWKKFWQTVMQMSRDDVVAEVTRFKAKLVLLRYFVAFMLGLFLWQQQIFVYKCLLGLLVAVYFFWSIQKNYHYAGKGWFYLPLLQLWADSGVVTGTMVGYWLRYKKKWKIK